MYTVKGNLGEIPNQEELLPYVVGNTHKYMHVHTYAITRRAAWFEIIQC